MELFSLPVARQTAFDLNQAAILPETQHYRMVRLSPNLAAVAVYETETCELLRYAFTD